MVIGGGQQVTRDVSWINERRKAHVMCTKSASSVAKRAIKLSHSHSQKRARDVHETCTKL